MTSTQEMAAHLQTPTRIGEEISVTGKWVPAKAGGWFKKSESSQGMHDEWNSIHEEAKAHEGVLSTEVNEAVGSDAVLIHHVFKNSESMVDYFKTTAQKHKKQLHGFAKPEIHLVRATNLSTEVQQQMADKGVAGTFANYLFGYVKHDYQRPDPKHAIQVTAKWTCKASDKSHLNELIHWWKQVGTDAFDLEKGLVRFEVYQVIGEDALIIHETFENTKELQYHLSKGTAERYKKDIDKVASPEAYFFRGPVSWTIRTYSKFLKLPATYSKQTLHHAVPGGNQMDGTF